MSSSSPLSAPSSVPNTTSMLLNVEPSAESSSTAPQHSHKTRNIALSVVFSLLLLLVLVATFIILRRRRARHRTRTDVDPSLPPPAPQMSITNTIPRPNLPTIPMPTMPAMPSLPKPSLQMPSINMHIPSLHVRHSSATSDDFEEGASSGVGTSSVGRIAEDPMSSGWVDGTWGRLSPSEGAHPSLTSAGGLDAPGPLRGDALRRDASRHSRRPRRNTSARTNASGRPTSPAVSTSAGSCTLVDVPLGMIVGKDAVANLKAAPEFVPPMPIPIRHPYATLPSIHSVSSIELGFSAENGSNSGHTKGKEKMKAPTLSKLDEAQGAVPATREPVPTAPLDRKSTRLNSSHSGESRMPSSA